MYDMYRENILDHAKNMRNRGLLRPCDIEFEGENPLCGDHLHLTLRVDENQRITDVGWEGAGCAISQASASMLGEQILGKTLEEARAIGKEDVFEMLGIPLSANRVKCALLGLKVLKVGAYGLADWQKTEDEE
ncbi:MAG: SUF system NifU family Fe-S cluster assembly protein [Chloroflexi bacterium]|nr:SUF system NifU family Fe-S cluster assembly protein [Chloroflexota bacterium]